MLPCDVVLPVDYQAFRDALLATAALFEIKYRLLDVEEITQGAVYHPQTVEGLGRREVGDAVSDHRHDEGVATALVEFEHTVGQLPSL